jgi:Protein of unknown function (DUF2934)
MARVKRARTTSTEAPAKPVASVQPEPANGNGKSSFDMETTIRARAYELYEKRGRQDGLDQQDWLQAETEILRQQRPRSA